MQVSKNQWKISKPTHGFSLIEVLVSMGLFSLSLISIVELQIQAHQHIADSSLKNLALAYASSRHEIYYIEKGELESSDVLKDKWENDIKQIFPDINIESQITVDKNFSLLMSWETSQLTAGCSKKSQERDCLQL